MKLITDSKVTLVSAPLYIAHPVYKLPEHDGDAANIIAMAGKVCYDSYGIDGRSISDHIESLVESEHYSVLEHVNIGVLIEGISRGCSHELVRHRHFSYSQRSTRYTAEGDAAIVLNPFYAGLHSRASTQDEQKILSRFVDSAITAVQDYEWQVEKINQFAPDQMTARERRKWCRGNARQLLPHTIETRLVMTGNLRSWREFLLKRSDVQAEGEIRRLAEHVFDVLYNVCPDAFTDFSSLFVGGFMQYSINE